MKKDRLKQEKKREFLLKSSVAAGKISFGEMEKQQRHRI